MSHDIGLTCKCVSEHRPPTVEYVWHHLCPLEYDGPTEDWNLVLICDNTHRTVHELLRELLKHFEYEWANPVFTYWGMRQVNERPFSHYQFDMAVEGYKRIAATHRKYGVHWIRNDVPMNSQIVGRSF